MRHRDLWLFVKSNGTSRMKRNGVPHQLDLMCRNATFFQKRARGVGPINFETLKCGVAVRSEQWNESYEAQWCPTPIGSDVPECHVLSETSPRRWPHQLRNAPVRSSGPI